MTAPAYMTTTALSKPAHDSEVMGDDDRRRRPFLRYPQKEVENRSLRRYVEGARRLVGQDQSGVVRHRDGDSHALAHPAGELVGVLVHPPPDIRHAHLREQVRSSITQLGPRLLRGVRRQRLDDLPPYGVDGVERAERVLKDHPDALATQPSKNGVRRPEHVNAVEPDASSASLARRLDQAQHRVHKGRLARA